MIIRDSQLGSVNYSTPKLLIVEVTPSPIARATSTNVVMIVGQFTRGDVNKLHRVGSLTETIKKVGYYKEGLDGFPFVKDFFDGNGSIALIARVASSGGVKAEVTITDDTDPTPIDLFTLTFDSIGTCGNNTTVSITEHPIAGYFNMVVRNSDSGELREYNKASNDVTNARYIGTLIANDQAKFFTFTSIEDDGTVPLAGDFAMEGGSNGTVEGSSVADSAYVGTESGGTRSGIQLGKSSNAQEVSIVVSARNNSTINSALITHVEDIKLSPRRTIITLSNTSVASAITAVGSMDSDKVKFVFPNVKVANIVTSELEEHNVTAFASANDSLLSYHLSASQTTLPSTVKDLVLDISPSEVDDLTNNRINPIVFKEGRGFMYASDYTTSSNPSLAQNTVRKAKDFFTKTFYNALQPYLSKPITPKMMADVRETILGVLRIEASAGRIGRIDGGIPYAVKCDSENNTEDTIKLNRLIVLVEIALLANADIIQLYLDAQQSKTIVNA